MYIFASFEFSDGLELAVAEMERIGTSKPSILVLPLDKRTENGRLFDTIHYADGKSFVDFAAVLGAILMLLGGIYGFMLKPGPVLCALIGLVVGLLVGYAADYLYNMRKRGGKAGGKTANRTEVFVMVKCRHCDTDTVKKILWNHGALGVALYDKNPQAAVQ